MTAAKELLYKYIQSTERVFAEIKLNNEKVYVNREKATSIVDLAKRYLEDAKYYQNRKEFIFIMYLKPQ